MGGEYARIRTAYHADAWLYGTTTTKEFTGFQRPVLDGSVTSVPEGDFVARRNAAFYYVSVDTEGEIGWESATFKRAGCPGAHIIEVVTGATSVSYLAYLREHRISYIVAGEAALDCRIAAEKLKGTIWNQDIADLRRRPDQRHIFTAGDAGRIKSAAQSCRRRRSRITKCV